MQFSLLLSTCFDQAKMKSCGQRMSLEDCLQRQQLYIIVDGADGKESRPLVLACLLCYA